MSNPTNIQKFRPSLSAGVIQYLVNLLRNTPAPQSAPEHKEAYKALVPFLAKIEADAIIPAYSASTVSRKELNGAALLESLGGSSNVATDHLAAIQRRQIAEYWHICYNKFLAQPGDCTEREKAAAREYRYLNDLMTPEEIADFEAADPIDWSQEDSI